MSKSWLITGCSTGFGRALAEVVLAGGDRVVATARRPETLVPLVERYDDRVLACRLDVTRPEDVEQVVTAARARFGAIDVLVNNAGYGQIGTIEDTGIDAARAVMETNYFGALAMIKAVLPEMIARRGGQIVNIGSVAGQIGFPALGYYSASKFAVAGLTESLGAEVAPLGIRVTLAELGPFATEFTRSMAIIPPSPHYDMAALAEQAGNAHWGAGAPPERGAAALVGALADAKPPRRLILGQPGLDVIDRHAANRQVERERWAATSLLETDTTLA